MVGIVVVDHQVTAVREARPEELDSFQGGLVKVHIEQNEREGHVLIVFEGGTWEKTLPNDYVFPMGKPAQHQLLAYVRLRPAHPPPF